ncbi:MAG: PqqD family protein [Eggerthellaceae bacterium]|nr:PqqD family protein [Eggerthellaceae bacterium]
MKLKNEFLTYQAKGESVLVPTAAAPFSGVVRGNKTLGAILECLKAETTEDAIVASLKARFDAPEGAIEHDVARALAELRRIGALDE